MKLNVCHRTDVIEKFCLDKMTIFDWKRFFIIERVINFFRKNSKIGSKKYKELSFSPLLNFFSKMTTIRYQRKLAALTSEKRGCPRNNQSQNSAPPGISRDYIAQVSKEIKWRLIKKLSREFSRTESRILCALSKLDEFLLNQHIRTISLTFPEFFRNANVENHEPSPGTKNDPHPKEEFSVCCASNVGDSDPDETSHNPL